MADEWIGQLNHTNGRRQDHAVTGSGETAVYRQKPQAPLFVYWALV